MRLNLKLVLVLLCLAVFLVTVTFWSHCDDMTIARGFLPKWSRRFEGIIIEQNNQFLKQFGPEKRLKINFVNFFVFPICT